MHLNKIILLPVCLVLSATLNLMGQNLPVQTVTVFKNGQSLIQKSGIVTTTNGKYSTTDLPQALFGTYWFDGNIRSVFSRIDSIESPMETPDTRDFLKKNIGKRVKIWLYPTSSDQDAGTISGILLQVNVNPPHDMSSVMLKTDDGKIAQIPNNGFRRIDYLEMENLPEIFAKTPKNRVEVEFLDKSPSQKLNVTYLTNQIGWTPIYSLGLTDKNRGILELRAEVYNDAENLGIPGEMHLVAGIPNFKFADRLSFMLQFEDLMQQLHRRNPNTYSGGGFVQALSNTNYSVPGADDARVGSGHFEGAKAEDYFFYTMKTGDFPKGSRYQLPVLRENVDVKHYYEVQIPRTLWENPYEQQPIGEAPKLMGIHFVEFLNPTKTPWTTGVVNVSTKVGAALQPISQGMLPFTAGNGRCKLKISESPEIQANHIEAEMERLEKEITHNGRYYSKIKVEGQITITNFKDEPITAVLHRDIEGTPVDSEVPWKTAQKVATYQINQLFEATWEVSLKPGEVRTWKYSFEALLTN